MMSIRNTLLVQTVRSAIEQTVPYALPAEVSVKFQAAAERFPIAPDPEIDIGRIPVAVTTWNQYMDYLDGIRRELENPREDTKTSGRLKIYKLSIVLIHAINNWLPTLNDRELSIAAMVVDIISHARLTVPVALSENGRKLWTYTFASNSGRHASLCGYLLLIAGRPDPVTEAGLEIDGDGAAGPVMQNNEQGGNEQTGGDVGEGGSPGDEGGSGEGAGGGGTEEDLGSREPESREI